MVGRWLGESASGRRVPKGGARSPRGGARGLYPPPSFALPLSFGLSSPPLYLSILTSLQAAEICKSNLYHIPGANYLGMARI